MKKGYGNLNEEKIKLRTRKSTKQWNKILDKFNVKKNGHTKTAKYLREKFNVGPWWAQVLTVRYEYKKRLRK